MNIGQKLKEARAKRGLTQEKVAEQIGVSRQTISNWENDRFYPDIVNLIYLSDLYSISLDELLKEDKKMIEHLENSTDVVKSRQRFSKLILIISYLLIWAMSIIAFWIGGKSDALGYTIANFYLVLPIATIIISVFIGKDRAWVHGKWAILLFFGFMYMFALYMTFSFSNMITFGKMNMPDFTSMLPGILSAGFGMSIGTLMRIISRKKENKNNS